MRIFQRIHKKLNWSGRRYVALIAGVLALSYIASAIYHVYKPLPDGLNFTGKLRHAEVKFLSDQTYVNAQGQQQQQMAMQIQQQSAQMKSQMDAQLEQVKGQMKERLEQIKGQIEMQKAQMEGGLRQAEIAVQQQIAQMDDVTKRYGIDADNYIETQYLDLQRQQIGIDQRSKDLDRALKSFESRIKASNDIQKQARTGNKIRD